jgi:hypothetical protein
MAIDVLDGRASFCGGFHARFLLCEKISGGVVDKAVQVLKPFTIAGISGKWLSADCRYIAHRRCIHDARSEPLGGEPFRRGTIQGTPSSMAVNS